MYKLYETMPASEIKQNTNAAFEKAAKGPIVVLSRTQPKAVIVSPEMWNATAERLAYLESMLLADAAAKRVWSGDYHTIDEIEKMMEG
ncbi:MAG: type II toxin-antitoxin system Phd/YefM family antitoxin [Chloroflexota bacterium]